VPTLIFDSSLNEPAFETKAEFYNDPVKLKGALGKVSHFVTCIGGDRGYARYYTSQVLKKSGLKPMTLIHPRSYIDTGVEIGEGSQFMPFSVVHKFARIGAQCILNTSCTVDHECIIGNGVHIMGNAALAGEIRVENFATIGTNATILPHVRIGEGAIIGAGAVVIRDVKQFTVVVGNPAKYLRESKPSFDKEVLLPFTK
jgi:sugar O-acyltransferase (sialic acid O-acetyltransferase NeuD family)